MISSSRGSLSFLTKWGMYSSADGQFQNPLGIATDAVHRARTYIRGEARKKPGQVPAGAPAEPSRP